MSPHAASDQFVVNETRALNYQPPREPLGERFMRACRAVGDTIAEYGARARTEASSYAGTIADKMKAVTHREPRPVTTTDIGAVVQFVWSPPVDRPLNPGAVVCIALPVRNPVAVLDAYVRAGVQPERIVFVGDPLTLSDAAYDGITRMGSLVHQTNKKASKEQAQQELTAYYTPPGLPREVPARNPNPYTWEPGPPRVTPEQLQALIDAVRARR